MLSTDNQDPIGYVRHEATPFDNAMTIVSRHCLASFRPHTWIAIVQRMQLSPTQAHLYFREIFDIAFLRVNMYHHYNRWHNLDYLNVTKQYESFTYIHEKQPKHYQQGKALMEGQQLALDAVTKCDSFWEIPTNLFSFFYGLPDDRGELRKLISASS